MKSYLATGVLFCLLVGCAYGQLGFGGFFIQPRPGTTALDSLGPCNGRAFANYTELTNTNGTGVARVQFTVVGNHGAPNSVQFSVGSVIRPSTQAEFTLNKEVTIPDGELNQEREFTFQLEDATADTFQLHYKTGTKEFFYCFDVSYGKYEEDISGANVLTFSFMVLVPLLLASFL